MELHYKILVVYLCLGALYITLKLRFVGRGKYEKFKNVVDEVSVITPEKMMPIASFLIALVTLGTLTYGVICWPYYAIKFLIKVVRYE